MNRTHPRRVAAVIAAAALVVGISACSPTETVGGDAGSTLNIAYPATSFTENFNFLSPTNTSVPPGSDLVYETLIKLSPSTGFTPEPWLASAWNWNADGTELTWTLRDDVTWSDGEPFTSTDVAFTLGLRSNPQLVMGNPGDITSVDTPDDTTVVVHYSEPSFAGFGRYYAVKILPEHLWASEDPTQFTDADPVGTGPFTVSDFGQQQVSYSLRDDYWGGESKGVQTVNYQAVATPDAILQNLLTGASDYAESALTGNPQSTFVAKDPEKNHFWLPTPGAGQALLFNNAVAPTNDVNIRQALYHALDAGKLVTLTPGNFATAANVTGLNEPAYTEWLDPQYRGVTQKQDPDAAKAALAASGYTVAGGVLTKDGQSYPLTLKTSPSQPAWDNALVGQIQDVLGIEITVDNASQNDDAVSTGDYQLAFGPDVPGQGAPGGLLWAVDAPTALGSPAGTNWARADSPEALALAKQLGQTDDIAAQQQLAFQIEKIIVDQRFTAPIAPYAWSVAYTSAHWTGWPDAKDPATVPPNGRADLILTILNLVPAGA